MVLNFAKLVASLTSKLLEMGDQVATDLPALSKSGSAKQENDLLSLVAN